MVWMQALPFLNQNNLLNTVIWGRDANGPSAVAHEMVKDELYNLDKDPQETTNLATRFPREPPR